jgi:hypothetical protein
VRLEIYSVVSGLTLFQSITPYLGTVKRGPIQYLASLGSGLKTDLAHTTSGALHVLSHCCLTLYCFCTLVTTTGPRLHPSYY